MAKRAPAPILTALLTNAPCKRGPTMNTSLEAGSWPIIRWPAVDIHRIEFVHLDSAFATAGCNDVPDAVGTSCWSGWTALGMVALWWKWTEIVPQVFVLSDPMGIDSNLSLLASDGGELSPLATTLVLNRIVAGLPWHAEAARAHGVRGASHVDALKALPPRLAPTG